MPVLKKRGPYAVLIPAALTCAVLVAVWLYRVDPEDSVYSPKCVFYLLTGLKCPGCGSQRCVQAQCTSGTLHTVSGSYVLFLDDETTIPGAL